MKRTALALMLAAMFALSAAAVLWKPFSVMIARAASLE